MISRARGKKYFLYQVFLPLGVNNEGFYTSEGLRAIS